VLECTVPRKYHGNIMGPKGHRIQELSKTHNVAIKIPDRGTEGIAFCYTVCFTLKCSLFVIAY